MVKKPPAMQEAWAGKIPWRRAGQPTPAFLPGESHGQRSMTGYSPRGRKVSDTTERRGTSGAHVEAQTGTRNELKVPVSSERGEHPWWNATAAAGGADQQAVPADWAETRIQSSQWAHSSPLA